MKWMSIASIVLLFAFSLTAQVSENIRNIEPAEDYDNIHVKKLYSDSLGTGFAIWVKKKVKAHRHVTHTEHLYVIEGEGKMTIGDKKYDIKPGDYLVIPKNTVHAVDEVTSENPLKVLSIQTPEFLGKDRVFVD